MLTYRPYQVEATTKMKSSIRLCSYAGKVFSAWTEVWSIASSSTAPIMAPGGRDLRDFRVSGRASFIPFLPSRGKNQDNITWSS